MRIGGVGVHGYDGAVISEESLALERFEDEGLQVELDEARLDELERGAAHGVHAVAGFDVGSKLPRRPAGFELLQQVSRTGDVDAERADLFNGARIDVGDDEDGRARRILHGNFLLARQQRAQRFVELGPARIDGLLAGQRVEHAAFDRVNELARFAFGGDQVEPAASDHARRFELQHAIGERVSRVMIEEEPARKAGVTQGGLNFQNAHG